MTDIRFDEPTLVTITAIVPPGLAGKLADGTRVLVRKREISWHDPGPLDEFIGQTKEVVILRRNPWYDEFEASIRLAQEDPWQTVAAKYEAGQLIKGTVVGVTDGGVFLEVEAGVVGLLSAAELPLAEGESPGDWFWIGDQVRALVTRVDSTRRRLGLSLATF